MEVEDVLLYLTMAGSMASAATKIVSRASRIDG